MASQEDRDQEFRVVDRRAEGAGAESEAAPGRESAGLPQPDFASFCLSLGTSALYHLGVVGDPQTGETAEPNLPLARQTIDIIEMLRDKTQGNLDAEESKLLEGLLYELHTRFLEARK